MLTELNNYFQQFSDGVIERGFLLLREPIPHQPPLPTIIAWLVLLVGWHHLPNLEAALDGTPAAHCEPVEQVRASGSLQLHLAFALDLDLVPSNRFPLARAAFEHCVLGHATELAGLDDEP